MACNCGGGGGALANYVVKDKNGNEVKKFTAVAETEVKVFAAKLPGATYSKSS